MAGGFKEVRAPIRQSFRIEAVFLAPNETSHVANIDGKVFAFAQNSRTESRWLQVSLVQ